MGQLSKPGATYKDLFNIPHNEVGEIIGGELVTHPRPAPRHALAASAVGALLFSEFAGNSGESGKSDWWILVEPECHLGTDIIVPDIGGWRKSTMPDLPDTAWFGVCPDWVCEVISPSTAKYDRGIKREIYAREGVGYYWIVDPTEKMIEVFVLEKGAWVLAKTVTDDDVANLVPFEILPFEVSKLWP